MPESFDFDLAARVTRLRPSMIWELMKLAARPGLISLGGGLPSPDSFPVTALRQAAERTLSDRPGVALQYSSTEGHPVLRSWVASHLQQRGLLVQADQVLITSGSQQGLDLAATLLLEPGRRIGVESPTYLGALNAFAPYEATATEIDGDAQGPTPEALANAGRLHALYLLPNYQNPSGRCLSAERRQALVAVARERGIPIIEDDPYGELWFDAPPPAPLASHWPEGTLYLGSFSKTLAPGLRLGYAVAPAPLYGLLVQAKQAADLHSGSFVQQMVAELLQGDLLMSHWQTVRDRYRAHRDAMAASLDRHFGSLARWQSPAGGMFFWIELRAPIDSAGLLPAAVERGVTFVPGSAFSPTGRHAHCLRLSFVTESPERIEAGVAALAAAVRATDQSGQAQ